MVAFGGIGDFLGAFVGYCLLVSINLKLGAAFARARGWQEFAIPKLLFLWPLITLAIFVLAVVLTIALAWLRLPIVLSQAVACLVLASGVIAVFYFVEAEPGRRDDRSWSRLRAVAALSVMSMVLAAGIGALYFSAKFTFLLALFLLCLYSTRFR